MTYSLITLLIITEYSDSARVWKVGGVWNTTQRAELTERMKRLRELQQKDAVIQRNKQELERNAETIQQKEATIRRNAQALQRNEATIHQFQFDIREKDLQIQQKNDVIQRHEGTITQQQKRLQGQTDNGIGETEERGER